MLLIDKRINSLAMLGDWLDKEIRRLGSGQKSELSGSINQASVENGWFTPEEILRSLQGINGWLNQDQLTKWANQYFLTEPATVKRVAVVMAGNLPLVNFHDFVAVLLTGHRFIGKLSSQDKVLLPALADKLIELEPAWKDYISFIQDKLSGFDAVIATGSNNSARYFEYYFGSYPHIIRKNRHSLAVLTGTETEEEFTGLFHDIHDYYGLGCRNVSMLWVPKGYSFIPMFNHWENYPKPTDHNKYRNNYDYYRSIYLLNSQSFFDTGYASFLKSTSLASPVSVVNYAEYTVIQEVETFVKEHFDEIQCIVGHPNKYTFPTIEFGNSQCPTLLDYPDGVDIIQFLLAL